jgi:plasmid stabilization system protein ParE
MTLRPPRLNSRKALENVLDYEIAQEQASALGRLGRALEAALAALSNHDGRGGDARNQPAAGLERERLLRDASAALWCFVVQREACGLRDQKTIMRDYGVPREVQNRMGASGTGTRRGSA